MTSSSLVPSIADALRGLRQAEMDARTYRAELKNLLNRAAGCQLTTGEHTFATDRELEAITLHKNPDGTVDATLRMLRDPERLHYADPALVAAQAESREADDVPVLEPVTLAADELEVEHEPGPVS